jgi:P-type E1-E2 ATPase
LVCNIILYIILCIIILIYFNLFLGLADTVRDESATVLAMLQKRGIDCYMITGDDITTALAIGQSLGMK